MSIRKFLLVLVVAAASFGLAGAGTAEAHKPHGKRGKKAARIFKKLDADRDGKLTRGELAARPKLVQRFDAMDTDKDGYLSKRELKQAWKKARAERKQKQKQKQQNVQQPQPKPKKEAPRP